MNWLPILPLLALLVFTPSTVPQHVQAWSDPTDNLEAIYVRMPTRVRGVAIDLNDPTLVIITLSEDTTD